ncbi:MAG TPA: hypothetical protein V6D06_05045 [Trichocoleus sp.]
MNKAFFLSIFVVVGAAGGVAAYYWNQATQLPDWYAPSTQGLTNDVGTASDLLANKLGETQDFQSSRSITLSEAEVNQMVIGAIAQTPQTAQLLEAAKGVNTSLENNRIESGMVINLSDIPAGALPSEGQQALSQLTERFPMLANRDVYIGIQGSPRVEEGRLVLDDNTVVTIGRFQLPLADLANQMGLSQGQIEEQLAQALVQNGVALEDLQIQDGQVVISGSAL